MPAPTQVDVEGGFFADGNQAQNQIKVNAYGLRLFLRNIVTYLTTSLAEVLPAGGLTNQALVKSSNVDYATKWQDGISQDILIDGVGTITFVKGIATVFTPV